LAESDIANGWTPDAQKFASDFFQQLKRDILEGKQLPPMSIARILNHWNVVGGEILHLAAEISNELRSR
jgi:hypothetical protein